MVINSDDFNEIHISKENLEKLKTPWEFQGYEGSVKVETNIINDINYNFLGIISDFYFIESLDNLKEFEKQDLDIIIRTLEENSNHHNFLLFLKYFFQTELKNYLDYPIKINPETKEIPLNFEAFKNVSDLWDFLLSRSRNDKYPLKLLVLIELYHKLFCEKLDEESIIRNINNLTQYDLKKFLLLSHVFIDNITTSLDESIKAVQTSLLSPEKKANSKHAYLISRELSLIESTVSTFERKIKDEQLYRFYNKKVNCLASASYNNKKFIAINGLDADSKYEKIIRIIQELSKPKEFKYIRITDGVRYYLNPEKSHSIRDNITYEMFRNYKNNCNEQSNKMNRMFTCCERKLIDNIIVESTENECPNIKLIITMKPCSLCNRTIKNIQRENKLKLEIHDSGKSSNLPEDTIRKYDIFADVILNYELNSDQSKRT